MISFVQVEVANGERLDGDKVVETVFFLSSPRAKRASPKGERASGYY